MILRDMAMAEALCRKYGFPPYGLAGEPDRQLRPLPRDPCHEMPASGALRGSDDDPCDPMMPGTPP